MNAWDRIASETWTTGKVAMPAPPQQAEALITSVVKAPASMAGVSAFRYRATIQGRQAVRFAGPGGFYDAELLKGGLGGLIGFGLQQLGRPSGLVARVRRGNFKVYAPTWTAYNPGAGTKPREDGKFQNRQGPCRILIIEGREVAVLRFRQKIPLPLIMALKCLFSGTEYTYGQPGLEEPEGEEHEQEGGIESQSAPADLPESEPGEDPGRGEPAVHA